MRRRALLAASAASGGEGGEFYCELWGYSPRYGYVYFRTATYTKATAYDGSVVLDINGDAIVNIYDLKVDEENRLIECVY